jgi:phosphonoacetaldehyde hydrolase
MTESLRPNYRSSVKAVVFDWAGTTVDYGCMAPAAVFVQVFAERGIAVTVAQARGPMGLNKRDHIRLITEMPPVAAQWQATFGRACGPDDVEALYVDFIPRQLAILADYAEPVPGAVATAAALRARGLKIGSTTGYNAAMMDVLAPEAARHGYAPEVWASSSDVPAGRPAPWMLFHNAQRLGVYPMAAIVKVGDTVPDIEEGLNAGTWTVGVALTGNEVGLTETEVMALPAAEREARVAAARQKLWQAGAHYVVDGIWEVEAVVAAINERLARGEQP